VALVTHPRSFGKKRACVEVAIDVPDGEFAIWRRERHPCKLSRR
jgi:hypothetical protein